MPPAHPLAAVTHPDPYPYYAQLARERPLYRDTALGMWIASHPDTIAAILRHPGAHVRPADEPVPRGLCPGPAGDLFGRFVRMNDGAAQARLKPLLTGFIAHRASEPLQAHHEGPLPRLPLQPAVPASQDWLAAAPHAPAAVDRYLYTAPVHAQDEMPEHYRCDLTSTDPFRNTRTIESNAFMTWFTNGNNYHVEHHMMPNLPIERLHDLHGAIAPRIRYYHRTYRQFYSALLRGRLSPRAVDDDRDDREPDAEAAAPASTQSA